MCVIYPDKIEKNIWTHSVEEELLLIHQKKSLPENPEF